MGSILQLENVTMSDNLKTSSHIFAMKGAPEVIFNFLKENEIPADYEDVYMKYTTQGKRVIALAWKPLTTPRDVMQVRYNIYKYR